MPALALLLMLINADAAPASRLAVIRPAPDFALSDQDGKPCRLSDHKGKVVFVSFIFTTCSGTCPATTHRLARVFHEIEKKPFKDRVHFISITLDPKRDSPEALRGYRRLYDIETPRWSHLTGKPAEVKKTLDAWDMWARPAANGQLDHPSRVFLVDPRGRIREIYNLDFLRLPWALEDVESLLAE
ncbi:MAG: SCO family protein [Gemmataceae bacterium]